METTASQLLAFAGRFHPLIVHLPIGGFGVLLCLELVHGVFPRRQGAACRGFVAGFVALTGVLAAVLGWLLYEADRWSGPLAEWHRALGIGFAVAACGVWLACALQRPVFYYLSLATATLLLGAAGHYGGTLTHGPNYLVEYAPEPLRSLMWVETGAETDMPVVANPMDAELYAHIVQPILAQNCTACHGSRLANGGLRVDSHEALLGGGSEGPAVVPSNAGESPIYVRMTLPVGDPRRMPPAGHPTAPTPDQIELVRWWIHEGAPVDAVVADLNPDARVRRALDALYPRPTERAVLLPAEQLDPRIADLRERYQAGVRRIAGPQAWVDANLSLRGDAFDDAALDAFSAIGPNMRALYLGGTAVTDGGVRDAIRRMPNLQVLHLDRTAVTDALLEDLADLQHLEILNLYGTGVSDAGVRQLQRLASLRSLTLWQTKVSEEGVRQLKQAFEDPEQVRQWEDEIAELKHRILRQVPSIEVGAPAPR